jgi:hypothetical protein
MKAPLSRLRRWRCGCGRVIGGASRARQSARGAQMTFTACWSSCGTCVDARGLAGSLLMQSTDSAESVDGIDAVYRDSADRSDRSASLTLNLGLIALPMQSADRLCITLLMQSFDSEQCVLNLMHSH